MAHPDEAGVGARTPSVSSGHALCSFADDPDMISTALACYDRRRASLGRLDLDDGVSIRSTDGMTRRRNRRALKPWVEVVMACRRREYELPESAGFP